MTAPDASDTMPVRAALVWANAPAGMSKATQNAAHTNDVVSVCFFITSSIQGVRCVFYTSARQNVKHLLPTVGKKSILHFIDDEDLLMLQIERGASGSNQQRIRSFDHCLRRDVATVGVIPDSDERLSDIPSHLDAARFDRRDQFFPVGIDG